MRLPSGHGLKENPRTLDENARHVLRAGPEGLRGTGKEANVKSNRIILNLFAWAFGMVPGPSAALRTQKNLPGEDHPERGGVRGWVIIGLLSAIAIAGLLTIAGPPLSALFNQFMQRAGW